ncbi:MAG: hypothetical protein WDO14_17450 [Bacteroidota bacterium]
MKFRKAARYVLVAMMVLLALCGIPVVPPKKMEMDVDDEVKTEIVKDDSEKP